MWRCSFLVLMVVLIVLLTILATTVTSAVVRAECPAGELPKCPFPDGPYSTFFPHPNDCRWFFHCSNGVAFCKVCPADLHWNVALETCDFPFRAGCISTGTPSTPPTPTPRRPTPTPRRPTPRTTTTTTTTPAPPCPPGELPKCPFPDGPYSTFFPHPNDCHWFFHCSHGVPFCKVCPAGLHWNAKLDTCDFPFRAGCV